MRVHKPIRVLIADDHPIIRMGLAALIDPQEDMQVIARADNGREAVDLFRQYRPDVTLMDILMPQMDGVEALEVIRAEYPAARIIILTIYQDEEDIYRSLRAGAYGYLLKDSPGEQILEAIRTVYNRQRYIPSGIISKVTGRLSGGELTSREKEVLRHMVSGDSLEEIGSALYISERTVKTHVAHIYSKLGVSDRAQAVVTAIQRGIIRI